MSSRMYLTPSTYTETTSRRWEIATTRASVCLETRSAVRCLVPVSRRRPPGQPPKPPYHPGFLGKIELFFELFPGTRRHEGRFYPVLIMQPWLRDARHRAFPPAPPGACRTCPAPSPDPARTSPP